MAALEVFPTELIELIMTSLELSDITSLRLTCRRIEDETSQQFGNAFRYKDVKLTTTALQKFVRITGQGRFGCLLRNCTLTGIASDEEITTDDVPEHGRLLTDAFRNLRHRSPSGGLNSLTLGLAGRVGGELVLPDDIRVRHGWRAIWDAAARTFRTTVTALEKSQPLPGSSHQRRSSDR
ncbi:hypothetical protein SLS53_005055 [Cytospora paraplurivora]|uniref:F-box domain-containing protein n=1 Tax=Cytospora paraplurivora TaxID=2898453 RepID=A0AAN9YGM9_9PEZI